MRAHIIYFNYLTPDGSGMSIGGIQTYITNLIPVIKECGYAVSIYQRATNPFHHVFDDYEVYGVAHKDVHGTPLKKALLSKALSHLNAAEDVLIYGCETCITKAVSCRTIAIQHGILWDVPRDESSSKWQYLKQYIGKCVMGWNVCQRVNKVDQLVCVDNNFVNWHRAVTPYPQVKHIVIPNFSDIPAARPEKENGTIRIIFARRLFKHRGTRLFANVADKLLAKYHKLDVIVAGTGPDAEYMHSKLDKYPNVRFVTYSSHESLQLHADKDIAVIPTIGSEGTSLSLLEAMASGCAVVCTNVGGMTNIILDGYNGLMISPSEKALFEALCKLIEDVALRDRLQQNAYETVRDAFSLEAWKNKWKLVISAPL